MKTVIVSAVRTPIGKFLGSLSELSAPELGAVAVRAAVERAGLSGSEVDEVIMGCALQAGLAQNPARQTALFAELPESVNAFTVNKVCGSGLKAIVLASQALAAGDADIIVAGGMESMSNAPHLVRSFRQWQKLGDARVAAREDSLIAADALSKRETVITGDIQLTDAMVRDGLWDCYQDCHMGTLAEGLASRGITREQQDAFALRSNQKAVAAMDSGAFNAELAPAGGLEHDEGPRRDSSMEKLASLKPVFSPKGTITAGNASQLSDGAAAVVVMSEKKAEELGCKILARIEGYASAHHQPSLYMTAPTLAVRKLASRTGRNVGDYGLVELNEAFALQSLAVVRELGLQEERVNVNGGAVALGHPIGASGARILVTLAHAMQKRGEKRGLATLCLGGGGAVAMEVSR